MCKHFRSTLLGRWNKKKHQHNQSTLQKWGINFKIQPLTRGDCSGRLTGVANKRPSSQIGCILQFPTRFVQTLTQQSRNYSRIVKRQNLSPLQRPDRTNFAFVSFLTDGNKKIICDEWWSLSFCQLNVILILVEGNIRLQFIRLEKYFSFYVLCMDDEVS